MNIEIPDFLIEISKRMNTDDCRSTAHPVWQVRIKEFIVTGQGCNDHHFEIIDDEIGTIYRSDKNDIIKLAEIIKEDYPSYFSKFVDRTNEDDPEDQDIGDIDKFINSFDPECNILPDGLSLLYFQEVERVLSMHFTEGAANQFVADFSHHFQEELYTYVVSAYWNQELRNLQDWIKSLTIGENNET